MTVANGRYAVLAGAEAFTDIARVSEKLDLLGGAGWRSGSSSDLNAAHRRDEGHAERRNIRGVLEAIMVACDRDDPQTRQIAPPPEVIGCTQLLLDTPEQNSVDVQRRVGSGHPVEQLAQHHYAGAHLEANVKLLVHVQRQPDMAYPGSATQQPGAAYQRAGDETADFGYHFASADRAG